MSEGTKDKVVLQSTPIPPWHSLVVVFGLLGVSIYCLPSIDDIDTIATVSTFTKRIFPNYFSLEVIAYIRAAFAIITILVCYYQIFLGAGIHILTPYLPGSKLYKNPFHLRGIMTMTPFTSWSWILLGLYFALSSYICFQQLAAGNGKDVVLSKNLLRLTLALWEVAAPFSLLVSSIIRYVIWPRVLVETKDTSNLRTIPALLMHNANVAFAMIDVAVLGGIPIRIQDFSLAPIVGCIYVIFSWLMACHWSDKKYGPQYIYFFLDPTLPGYTPSIAILGLLFVLIVVYMIDVGIGYILVTLKGSSIITHILFGAVISGGVMKFQD